MLQKCADEKLCTHYQDEWETRTGGTNQRIPTKPNICVKFVPEKQWSAPTHTHINRHGTILGKPFGLGTFCIRGGSGTSFHLQTTRGQMVSGIDNSHSLNVRSCSHRPPPRKLTHNTITNDRLVPPKTQCSASRPCNNLHADRRV